MNQDYTMRYNYTIAINDYGSKHYFDYPCMEIKV